MLRRFYVDRGLVAEEVARRLGCSATTVFRRLRRFGIPVRSVGPSAIARWPSTGPLWSPQLAYVVGLIATDGNLSRDGRHLSICSIDLDVLETARRCLGLDQRIALHENGTGPIYRLQWSDRAFYDWLVTIGLTPAKSLTLRPLRVPDIHFADFFRGCVDGDGSVLVYTDRYHTRKNERYVYERLYVSLVSASRPFIEWMQGSVCRLTALCGSVTVTASRSPNPMWKLRYAKAESIRALRWMYYAPDVPALSRKRIIAAPFLVERACRPPRGPGRPVVI